MLTQLTLSTRHATIILVHALAGWAWCAAVIGVGRQFLSMEATLALHLVAGPLGYVPIAYVYFSRFGRGTSPVATAVAFIGVALILDLTVVALLIERSFAMFASPIGTWIPLALIFGTTWITGSLAPDQPVVR